MKILFSIATLKNHETSCSLFYMFHFAGHKDMYKHPFVNRPIWTFAASHLVLFALAVFVPCTRATNFTYTIPVGIYAIANPVDASVCATNLIPEDGSADGSYVYVPKGCQSEGVAIYTVDSEDIFGSWAGINAPVDPLYPGPPFFLAPGQGFFFNNNVGSAITINVNGPSGTSSPLSCGCGVYNLVGSVTGEPATYQDITGSAPVNGSRLVFFPQPINLSWGPEYLYACGGWTVYSGGSWVPATPPPLPVGQAVLVMVPCNSPLTGLGPVVVGSAYIGTGTSVKNYVLTVENYGPNPSSAVTLQLTGLPSTLSLTPPAGASVISGGFSMNIPAGLSCGDSLSFPFSLAAGSTPAGTFFTMNANFLSTYTQTDSLTTEIVGSYNPDDQNGPLGIGPNHYLTGYPPLTYTISFENPASASSPVQKVVVTDILDPTTLALGTFHLGAITFGNQVLTPLPGVDAYSNTVPYNLGGSPANAANLKVVASINQTSLSDYIDHGTITWTFQTLDPNTGLPPTNSQVGFLPPNTTPPAGQGTVSFTIDPLPILVTGNLITNTANMVFGTNASVATEMWTNTILETLPPLTITNAPSGQITINWQSWTLQEASSINGPWTNSMVQTPPWRFAPSEPVKFYRLQAP